MRACTAAHCIVKGLRVLRSNTQSSMGSPLRSNSPFPIGKQESEPTLCIRLLHRHGSECLGWWIWGEFVRRHPAFRVQVEYRNGRSGFVTLRRICAGAILAAEAH